MRFRVILALALTTMGWACSAGNPTTAPARPAFTPGPDASTPAVTLELVESWPRETNLDNPEIRDTHEVWLQVFSEAQTSIDLLFFYGADAPDSRLGPIVDALARARRRGVRVRAIVDAGFSAHQPEVLAAIKGMEVRTVDFKSHTGGVQHAKLFVVDAETAFVGSQNFDWRSLEHIQELGVLVRGAGMVDGVVAIFEHDWRLAGGASREEAMAGLDARGLGIAQSADFEDAKVMATVVASPRGWLPARDALEAWEWTHLERAIRTADRSIRLAVLSYQTRGHDGDDWHELDDALRAAAERGVAVELLVSSWETRPGRIEMLQSLVQVHGIDVRVVEIPLADDGFIPFARTVHAKYMTVDGVWSWTGSSNAGGDYFLRSRNVGLVVEGETMAAALDRFFLRTWESPYAADVDPERSYPRPRFAE